MEEDIHKRQVELLISRFSDEYLNDEYKDINIRLAEKLSQGVSFTEKDIEFWACAIIYAVGQLNFLFDNSFSPYISQDDLCYFFDQKRTRIVNMARDIRRFLKLKHGNEEFSTEFVLSLNIPDSDEDLKRIRSFDEVRTQISRKRPENIESIENDDLLELILRNDERNELFQHLRVAYFIMLQSGFQILILNEPDGKFKIPIFTSIEKCRNVMEVLDNLEMRLWPFFNVCSYLKNEMFEGVVINPETDNILMSKETIIKVFPNHDDVDYAHIFYSGKH